MKTSTIVSLRLVVSTFAVACLLTGCGLAETTAVTATQAATAAEQAKQAKELEAKVRRDIEAAQQAAADARNKAEAESQ